MPWRKATKKTPGSKERQRLTVHFTVWEIESMFADGDCKLTAKERYAIVQDKKPSAADIRV